MDASHERPSFRDDSAHEQPIVRPTRFRIKRRSAPGAAPGQILPDPDALPPEMRVIAYGPDEFLERPIMRLEELDELVGKYPVIWLDMDGLGNVQLIKAVGERFGLHPLALEDVVNVHQRAKVEQYGEQLFAVIRAVSEDERFVGEQISMFVSKTCVVTFQEVPGDSFDPVRQRLREGSGRIRSRGTDYLMYALLDAVVDRYFPSLEGYGERLEHIEKDLFGGTNRRGLASRIHAVKWDMLTVRHAVWPLRELLRTLLHDPTGLIHDETKLYLRDTADHVSQLIDLLESYREMGAGMVESHLALASHRLNEVMKVLTMVSTIFIPLSFVAGVYGMNFEPDAGPLSMPELNWPWAYPVVLFFMACVAGAMVYFFWKRGWLQSKDE